MEQELASRFLEIDITRDECLDKRKQFFKCVIEKKNNLTNTLNNEEWKNYDRLVNNLTYKCYEDRGLKKCENYFTLFDIKY